jgi:hypothetical protein
MTRPVSPWPVLMIMSSAAAAFVTVVDTDAWVRPVIVLWFLMVCPGMALTRFLHLREPIFEWMLAVALSLAVDAFVAGILLYAGRWSPPSAFAILLGLTVGGTLLYEMNAFLSQRRKLR